MENLINENKAKFFGQHIGCNVHIPDGSVQILSGVTKHEGIHFNLHWWVYFAEQQHLNIMIDHGRLVLKPLSQITNEDAIEVAKIMFPKHAHVESITVVRECNTTVEFGDLNRSLGCVKIYYPDLGFILNDYITHETVYQSPESISKCVDYLRSKGYALPWMGISVENMETAGWIKLIES